MPQILLNGEFYEVDGSPLEQPITPWIARLGSPEPRYADLTPSNPWVLDRFTGGFGKDEMDPFEDIARFWDSELWTHLPRQLSLPSKRNTISGTYYVRPMCSIDFNGTTYVGGISRTGTVGDTYRPLWSLGNGPTWTAVTGPAKTEAADTAGTTVTVKDTGLVGQYNDDYWNGGTIKITSGTYSGQERIITDYVNNDGTGTTVITFSPGLAGNSEVGAGFSLSHAPVPGEGVWSMLQVGDRLLCAMGGTKIRALSGQSAGIWYQYSDAEAKAHYLALHTDDTVVGAYYDPAVNGPMIKIRTTTEWGNGGGAWTDIMNIPCSSAIHGLCSAVDINGAPGVRLTTTEAVWFLDITNTNAYKLYDFPSGTGHSGGVSLKGDGTYITRDPAGLLEIDSSGKSNEVGFDKDDGLPFGKMATIEDIQLYREFLIATTTTRYRGGSARQRAAFSGTTSAAGTASTLVDDSLDIDAYPDDYWNGAVLELTSGTYNGSFVVVTDFVNVGGNITFTPSLAGAPGNGVTYTLHGARASVLLMNRQTRTWHWLAKAAAEDTTLCVPHFSTNSNGLLRLFWWETSSGIIDGGDGTLVATPYYMDWPASFPGAYSIDQITSESSGYLVTPKNSGGFFSLPKTLLAIEGMAKNLSANHTIQVLYATDDAAYAMGADTNFTSIATYTSGPRLSLKRITSGTAPTELLGTSYDNKRLKIKLSNTDTVPTIGTGPILRHLKVSYLVRPYILRSWQVRLLDAPGHPFRGITGSSFFKAIYDAVTHASAVAYYPNATNLVDLDTEERFFVRISSITDMGVGLDNNGQAAAWAQVVLTEVVRSNDATATGS